MPAPGPRVAGQVDYRLARNVGRQRVPQGAACRGSTSATPTPSCSRAAVNVGDETREDCPICEEAKVRLVSYVFGSRLPPSGVCVTSKREMTKLSPGGHAADLLRGRGLPRTARGTTWPAASPSPHGAAAAPVVLRRRAS